MGSEGQGAELGWVLTECPRMLGPGGHYCLVRSRSTQPMPSFASAVPELQISLRRQDVVGRTLCYEHPLFSGRKEDVTHSCILSASGARWPLTA